MNGLVRKEIRSILPVWILALVLATLPVWVVWPGPGRVLFQSLGLMVFGPFCLGVLLLSISPFGQELNWGTFAVLLSQPIPRPRVWVVKVTVVAIALGLAFAAFAVSNHISVGSALESMKHTVWRNVFDSPGERTEYFVKLATDARDAAARDTWFIGGLAVIAGFAGGLWTTLLFRQVAAAFLLTLLLPMGLTILVTTVVKGLPDTAGRIGLALGLITYSAAGFFWARRLFLSMQDTQWTGGVVALTSLRELSPAGEELSYRRKHKPVVALLRKEFQAQQVNILLAGGLLFVHLGVILLRRLASGYLGTHQSIAMGLEMVPLLWLIMPLLVGSVAVAEERKLATFQSNLCLPPRRRLQFLAKLVVAMALGILFGGALPLLVERLASHNSITGNTSSLVFLSGTRSVESVQITGSIVLTWLAFYASTLSANTLQAMGTGLLGSLLVCVVIVAAQHAGASNPGIIDGNSPVVLWIGDLIWWIGWPAMGLTLLVLAYRNYGRLQPDLRTWLHNAAALLAMLLCVAAVTTTVYHRVWEAWLPDEPSHRFTLEGQSFVGNPLAIRGPTRPRPLNSGYFGITVQDLTPALAKEFKLAGAGGALIAHVDPESPADRAGLKTGDRVVQFDAEPVIDSRKFAEAVAKTRPGSKVSLEIENAGSTRTVVVTAGATPAPRRVARQRRTDCKVAAADSQRAVVLPDGRLWLQLKQSRLIDQRFNKNGMVAWYETGLQHTGFLDGSNWKDVGITPGACFGIQKDGTLWNISQSKGGRFGAKQVGVDSDWDTISAGGEHFCAVKTDGSLWQWGWQSTPTGPQMTAPKRVGTDSDWVAVAIWWTENACVKADGSIWRVHWNPTNPHPPEAWLLGACSEPVSFALAESVVASVCADGSLWIGGDLTNSVFAQVIGGSEARRAGTEMVRWGADSDWREIRLLPWHKAVGLKRDGTIWEWDMHNLFRPNMISLVTPTRPSRYADWLSVCEDNNAFLALARDGSLCLWGDPYYRGYDYWYGYPDPKRILMPSRIKARRVADLAERE